MTTRTQAHDVLLPTSHLLVAATLLIGIWAALPARYVPVDVCGTALAGIQLAAGLALLSRRDFAAVLSLWAARVTLALGALCVSALCWTAAHLAGLYGPVGSGGALLMGAVAALVLPYLVGLPLLQVAWARARAGAAEA